MPESLEQKLQRRIELYNLYSNLGAYMPNTQHRLKKRIKELEMEINLLKCENVMSKQMNRMEAEANIIKFGLKHQPFV